MLALITDKYVNDEDEFPAGSAAIALFEAIGKTNSSRSVQRNTAVYQKSS
jgi:hypothetical protein